MDLMEINYNNHDMKNDIESQKIIKKKRFINLIILIFLWLEIMKLILWIILPSQNPLSLLTGSFFASFESGNMFYYLILSNAMNAFITRLVLFFKEKENRLHCILDPLIFRFHSHHEIEEEEHEIELRKTREFEEEFHQKTHQLLKTVNVQRRVVFYLTNTLVLYSMILSINKFNKIYFLSFIIGFISHGIQSWFSINGSVVTGFLWKTSLFFLRMRLLILRERILEFTRNKILNKKNNEINNNNLMVPQKTRKLRRRSRVKNLTSNVSMQCILQEIDSLMTQTKNFNSCLNGFLFASMV